MCGGSGGGKSGGGGGGAGGSEFNRTESIYTRSIDENLNRVRSGAISKSDSLKQYGSELRQAQKKLKSEGPNTYRQNQIAAIKYAISETKKL